MGGSNRVVTESSILFSIYSDFWGGGQSYGPLSLPSWLVLTSLSLCVVCQSMVLVSDVVELALSHPLIQERLGGSMPQQTLAPLLQVGTGRFISNLERSVDSQI